MCIIVYSIYTCLPLLARNHAACFVICNGQQFSKHLRGKNNSRVCSVSSNAFLQLQFHHSTLSFLFLFLCDPSRLYQFPVDFLRKWKTTLWTYVCMYYYYYYLFSTHRKQFALWQKQLGNFTRLIKHTVSAWHLFLFYSVYAHLFKAHDGHTMRLIVVRHAVAKASKKNI